MRPIVACSVIRRRGFAALWSRNLTPPFYLFSSDFYAGIPDPRIDFSNVKVRDDAIQMFFDMLRMDPLPYVTYFSKLLSITSKMQQYSLVLKMFDVMRRRRIPVNGYTMSIVINCFCLLKTVDFGFAIMGLFFKIGYSPDAATFSPLIKGLFLVDKDADAVKLFEKVVRFGLCESDDVMILTVVNGLCKVGQIDRARDLLCRLKGPEWRPKTYSWLSQLSRDLDWRPDVEAYKAVLNALCKVGRVDDALQLLSEMIDKGISPDVVTYTSMIHGLSKVGRLKDVKDLSIYNSDISPNAVTYTILINAFCKDGKMKDAEDVLKIMMQHGLFPDIVTYNALINGYCMQGYMNKAEQVFGSIVDNGEVKPTIITYTTLISAYCKSGRVDEAWLLFLKIPREGLEYNAITYNTMIQGFFSNNRFDECWELYKSMETRRLSPSLHTYAILLEGLCRNGKTYDALSLFRMIEGKGIVPNVGMYRDLITELCKNGKLDVARDLFYELRSKGLHPDVQSYNMIVRSLSQEGCMEEVKRLLSDMENCGCPLDSVTYNVISRSLLKKNKLHKAMPKR